MEVYEYDELLSFEVDLFYQMHNGVHRTMFLYIRINEAKLNSGTNLSAVRIEIFHLGDIINHWLWKFGRRS